MTASVADRVTGMRNAVCACERDISNDIVKYDNMPTFTTKHMYETVIVNAKIGVSAVILQTEHDGVVALAVAVASVVLGRAVRAMAV